MSAPDPYWDADWPGDIEGPSCCCNLAYTDEDGRDVVEYWPEHCPLHKDDPSLAATS